MKFRNRKAKPATGMELSVTLCMSVDLTPDDAALRIVQFFEAVNAASSQLEAAWIRIKCTGIPEELEDRLQVAFDAANKRPQLKLIIDNSEKR